MLSKRWTQISKTLSLSFYFLFTFYFFDSHLLSPIRLSSFLCYTLNHKSNRPATAPSASPMHHADLGESIDSAFSLVRLLLLLSWALSVSGPRECGGVWVVVPQGPNRTIHTRTHTHTHLKSNQCSICNTKFVVETGGLTAEFRKDRWRSAPLCQDAA